MGGEKIQPLEGTRAKVQEALSVWESLRDCGDVVGGLTSSYPRVEAAIRTLSFGLDGRPNEKINAVNFESNSLISQREGDTLLVNWHNLEHGRELWIFRFRDERDIEVSVLRQLNETKGVVYTITEDGNEQNGQWHYRLPLTEEEEARYQKMILNLVEEKIPQAKKSRRLNPFGERYPIFFKDLFGDVSDEDLFIIFDLCMNPIEQSDCELEEGEILINGKNVNISKLVVYAFTELGRRMAK